MKPRLLVLGRALGRAWVDGRPVERVAYVVGALLIVSGLTHVAVLLVTGGSWTGPVSLRKPATFGLSFGITLATAAWVTSYLAIGRRLRASLLGAFAAACVLETSLITLQAWRGVPSHFNVETGFDSAVSRTLAGGGFLIVLLVLGFAASALARAAGLAASMRLAVRYGLVVLVGAMLAGAAMIADGVTQVRAGNPTAAYQTAGSLKPIHAVAMHAVLVLPGLAWLLRFADWPERRRTRLVGVACGAYTLLALVVAAESIAGVSPLAAPPAALAVSIAALAALVAIGAYAGLAALAGTTGDARRADAEADAPDATAPRSSPGPARSGSAPAPRPAGRAGGSRACSAGRPRS